MKLLSKEHAIEICKIGQGADCCSWLICGSSGFECSILEQHPTIVKRRAINDMVAMRDGCPEMKNQGVRIG